MAGRESQVGGDQLLEELYGLGGVAHPGGGGGGDDDDDDDGDSGEEEDLEATPSYQLKKRQHH